VVLRPLFAEGLPFRRLLSVTRLPTRAEHRQSYRGSAAFGKQRGQVQPGQPASGSLPVSQFSRRSALWKTSIDPGPAVGGTDAGASGLGSEIVGLTLPRGENFPLSQRVRYPLGVFFSVTTPKLLGVS